MWFAGAGKQWSLSANRVITLVGDLSWGDDEHMDTEFGLSASDGALLGLAPYAPEGGIKSSTLSATLEWMPRDRWSFIASLETEFYFDEAADSPLLDELGSAVTVEVEVGVLYRF